MEEEILEINKNSSSDGKNRRKALMIILLILAIFMSSFIVFSSTFFSHQTMKMNIDINNDGIPDLNIDISGDGKCDLNCDTNGDGKPNVNITLYSERKAIFNIDLNKDGKPDANLINQPKPGDECKINCDTDKDGWPDENIDVTGNGDCDLNCGKDEHGSCNLNCDTNEDGICDLFCDDSPSSSDQPSSSDRPSSSDEQSSSSEVTPVFIINFDTGNNINVSGLQTNQKVIKTLSITNDNPVDIGYTLRFEKVYNDFISDNFKYDVILNGITIINKAVVPKKASSNILAPANIEYAVINKMVHNYQIVFYLEEKNVVQNEDQGKTFKALIKVESAQ